VTLSQTPPENLGVCVLWRYLEIASGPCYDAQSSDLGLRAGEIVPPGYPAIRSDPRFPAHPREGSELEV